MFVSYRNAEQLTAQQIRYGYRHTSTRIISENTFRKLSFSGADVDRMTSIIIGCCILVYTNRTLTTRTRGFIQRFQIEELDEPGIIHRRRPAAKRFIIVLSLFIVNITR